MTTRTPRWMRLLRHAPALLLAFVPSAPAAADDPPTRRVAAVVTEYRHNSHADMIVSRLLLTDMLDGTGRDSPLKLASLYTDQKPPNDISRLLAASHRFPIKSSIAETLTLGTGKLAVEGVLLVAEHGDLPAIGHGQSSVPQATILGRDSPRVPRQRARGAGLHRQAPLG